MNIIYFSFVKKVIVREFLLRTLMRNKPANGVVSIENFIDGFSYRFAYKGDVESENSFSFYFDEFNNTGSYNGNEDNFKYKEINRCIKLTKISEKEFNMKYYSKMIKTMSA